MGGFKRHCSIAQVAAFPLPFNLAILKFMSDSCFIYFLWAPLPHRCTHSLTTSKLLHSNYCPSILLFLLLSQPEYQPLLSVSPTPLPCLCSANLAYLPVQLYWRNSQKLYCISSLIPSMSSASPCSLCKIPISWGIASSYLSCPDQLSSLILQLCPVPTFLCLESLEGECWPCSWCWCHHGAHCPLPALGALRLWGKQEAAQCS